MALMAPDPYVRIQRFRGFPPTPPRDFALTGSHSPDSDRSAFDTVIRTVVAAVLLLVPFVFYPGLADPFQLPKQILFEMGALLILGIWLGRVLTSGRVAILRSGVAGPMLLLVFIAFLSTFQA